MSPMKQTGFRLPHEMIERIDAYAGREQAKTPGAIITRNDACRMLLAAALDAADAKNPPATPAAAKAKRRPKGQR